MINEVLEAEQYLQGKGVTEQNLYRACFAIGRLLHSQGKTKVQIRKEIFDWANRLDIYIPFSVNKILYHVENTQRPLRGAVDVYVSRADKDEIDARFDSRVTKRTALAVLCYAKVAADQDGDFQVSSNALSYLVGVHPANLRGRYLKELVDFQYLKRLPPKHGNKAWRKGNETANSSNWYHANVPLVNEGQWKLEGNDIIGLFKKIYE